MKFSKTLSIFSTISFLTSLAVGINFTDNKVVLANINQYGFRSIQSSNSPQFYIRHRNYLGYVETPTDRLGRKDATFKLVQGLADSSCTSFESLNYPGHYLRHQNSRVKLSRLENSQLFQGDATFCQKPGLNGNGISYASFNFPGHYLRHRNSELWLDTLDNTELFNKDATFYSVDPLYTGSSRFPMTLNSGEQTVGNHWYMQTNVTVSNNGRIDAVTKTKSCRTTGFTGGVWISLLDKETVDEANILYISDVESYGVNGKNFSGCEERSAPWSDTVPADTLSKVRGIVIHHAHDPKPRVTKEDVYEAIRLGAEIYKTSLTGQ